MKRKVFTKECRLLQVSRSGFYAWQCRPESRRAREDRSLLARIEAIHRQYREAYGTVKTWKELRAQDRSGSDSETVRGQTPNRSLVL